MQIPFSKISKLAYPFDMDYENLRFSGTLERINQQVVHCSGKLSGFCETLCAACGESIELEINLNIELDLSDGLFKDEENELSDTMEFFDQMIDLAQVASSELELYLSDYFYCEKCN